MKKLFIIGLIVSLCGVASAQDARVYCTTADGSKLLQQSTVSPTDATTSKLTLNPSVKYQEMDGFGFAITYSTCYNLLKMKDNERDAFLQRTFSPSQLGASYVRISIGCNDFSSKTYTLCDWKGIDHFALQKDEKEFVLPILKQIIKINPDVKVIAAPWTCPRWMKVESLNNKKLKNSWTDGHLNPDYYADYAEYFVKFVQAMQAEGISIYAVSPQNEPLNKGNCASLYMPWAEQAAFLKHLAPAFKQAGLTTKIYVYDHNYNYDNVNGQEDYPIQVYNALSNELEGSELIVGAAYHNYGGSPEELDDIAAKAPEKELIFSETSIGTWNNGRDLSKRLVDDAENVVLATVKRGCKAVLVWNLMLDSEMGPNLDGGCQTCVGAVDIDKKNYSKLTYNSHYYIITHMSSVVQPGATRIGITGSTVSAIKPMAFSNPDGSTGIVFVNNGYAERTYNVTNGTTSWPIKIGKNGITSVLIPGESSGIGSITVDETKGSDIAYDTLGRRTALTHGIKVKKGRKVLEK